MLRSVLGVVAGVAVGACIFFGADIAAHAFFPSTEPLGGAATQSVIVGGWLLGVFAGGAVASLLARRWAPAAWVVAATLCAMAVISALGVGAYLLALAAVGVGAAGGWASVKATGAGYAPPASTAQDVFAGGREVKK